MSNTPATSINNNQSLLSWWVALKITTNYSNFSREDNILVIGGSLKKNTEILKICGKALCILNKALCYSPTLADNQHEIAVFQRRHFLSAFLYSQDPLKAIKMPINKSQSPSCVAGGLHHVRKETSCCQPEEKWHGFVVIEGYLLSSDTKLVVI